MSYCSIALSIHLFTGETMKKRLMDVTKLFFFFFFRKSAHAGRRRHTDRAQHTQSTLAYCATGVVLTAPENVPM